MKRITAIALALAIGPAFGQAHDEGTSHESAYYTYEEDTGVVTFMVDSFTAFYSTDQEYMPLHIGVGVFKGKPVTMTLESFLLTDSAGNAVNAVPFSEIQANYKRLRQDKNILLQRPMNTGEKFSVLRQVSATFYPVTESPRMATGTVELPTGTWWQDSLYFPVPDVGLDGVLSMELKAEGVDEPITVKFRIPHNKKHHKEHKDTHTEADDPRKEKEGR